MITPAMVALTAQPRFHSMLLRLVERARSSCGSTSMTNACKSGVDACMNVARSQNAPTATGRWRSPPSVTRNGSERSSDATAVRSFPNRRATAGAASAATAVNTWAMLKNVPIWAHQQRLFFYGAIAFNMDLCVVDAAMVFHAVRDLQPSIIIGPPVFYETFQRQNLCRWFGPKTRVLVTGMAKSRRSTLDYYRELGLPLYEVYAMTETGIVAANTPECQRLGSVGKPPPGTEVRIAEDGDILATKRHFQTRAYFRGGPAGLPHDRAGGEWFLTGDVGHFDEDGFLYVDGRKDRSEERVEGQKLQPAIIEADLENTPLVRKAVVLQDADHPYLMAVIDSDQRGEPDLEPKLQALIDVVNEKLPSWFRIERFVVSPEPFTPQNGFLTPNLKVARPKIAQAFTKAKET